MKMVLHLILALILCVFVGDHIEGSIVARIEKGNTGKIQEPQDDAIKVTAVYAELYSHLKK